MYKLIVIVGCGGTGSNLAPMLSRMLRKVNFLLIDGDSVDSSNIERQTFQEFNLYENKAQALSRKLNSNFKNTHLYYDKYIENVEGLENLIKDTMKDKHRSIILIGCVDNNSTRLILEETYKKLKNYYLDISYIDSGNEDTYGTIIVTNKDHPVMRSEIFEVNDEGHPIKHCDQLIAEGDAQQYQINLDMAISIAKVVFALDKEKSVPAVIKINDYERTIETTL